MSPVRPSQTIDGIVLVNKPQGLTSNAALQRVKKLYQAKKAGHTGSLDPLATGMLPICFGEATKYSQYLLDDDKTYLTTGLLGCKTTTGDAQGSIIAEAEDVLVTEHDLQAVIKEFSGPVMQTPSMYSALKHQGKPLYEYARKGISVPVKPRLIFIRDIQLTAFDGRRFSLKVTCSKGTYIRNLVEDIGEKLGVGAHVVELHRLSIAAFADQQMYRLEELITMEGVQLLRCMLPPEQAIKHLPAMTLSMSDIISLRQGKILSDQDNSIELGQEFRIYDVDGQFIGLAVGLETGWLKAKRLAKYCTKDTN